MNSFKSFLLASTIIATLSPFPLSASSNISPEELGNRICIARAAPVCVQPEVEAPRGWFSSFRQSAGNLVRWAGDQLRTDEDTSTAAGNLKEVAKDIAAKYVSTKVVIPVTSAIFNPFGNGMRKVGQWIKGGEETQTTTRVILNNLGLKHGMKQAEIEQALHVAATALVRVDESTAPEEYLKVVKGLNNRGYSTKQIDALDIYMRAVVQEELRQNGRISFQDFYKGIMAKNFDVLENLPSVSKAGNAQKVRVMQQYLEDAYTNEALRIKLNDDRQVALAAASVNR